MLGGCRLIPLPKIEEKKGTLTFCEATRHIPFEIKRVYYLTEVPADEFRGGHAHKQLKQCIIAASGSFDVILKNAEDKQKVHLNSSPNCLYIPRMVWHTLENFSSGSVCLVVASEHFDEADYYRDYSEFLKAAEKSQ